jgi:RHH-type proline utilization regulon transcriptional repressor/proline dehydrogenase/delta 1-pyrroline-5-carboxylate dehydrogenase
VRLPLPEACAAGSFVAPTLIEIGRIADVEREVFGPVLHVLRFARGDLDQLVGEINAAGFGLTFGLHTRIDETISRVVNRVEVGNVYVNRNIIGATVGVQPFGGSGLSGTGPKAGGPLYLGRLLASRASRALDGFEGPVAQPAAASAFTDWLRTQGHDSIAERMVAYSHRSALGLSKELPGPVGERNLYLLRARGRIGVVAQTLDSALTQIGAVLATGNSAVVEADHALRAAVASLPASVSHQVMLVARLEDAASADHPLRAVLTDVAGEALIALGRRVAGWAGPIAPIQSLSSEASAAGDDFALHRLLEEMTITTNTAAAGGNASLMSIG